MQLDVAKSTPFLRFLNIALQLTHFNFVTPTAVNVFRYFLSLFSKKFSKLDNKVEHSRIF
jgi:hypothetical protein